MKSTKEEVVGAIQAAQNAGRNRSSIDKLREGDEEIVICEKGVMINERV